jgi:hypothetical protein
MDGWNLPVQNIGHLTQPRAFGFGFGKALLGEICKDCAISVDFLQKGKQNFLFGRSSCFQFANFADCFDKFCRFGQPCFAVLGN